MTQAPPLPIPDASAASAPASPPSAQGMFAALRHRNFQLFFWGQLISLTGTWMDKAAEGWLVYTLTNSKMLLGVIAAAGTAPMIVFSFWGGSIADRLPKRSILVVTQSVSMVLALAEAYLVLSGLVRPWQIIALAALGGVVMAFDMPARQAFVIEMTSRKDLLNAISLNSSVFNAARLVGPSVAGLVMARLGIGNCFLLDGLSFLAVIAGLLMMRPPRVEQAGHAGSPLRHALGGLTYVWRDRRLFVIFALFTTVGIFGWSYSVLMPAYARDVMHAEETGYGMLMSAAGLGAMVGALVNAGAGHLIPRRQAVLGGVWLFSGMLVCFALTRVYALALLFLAIGSFGMMLFMSTVNTLIQTSVPDAMRGRVMGVWALLFGAMVPIGGIEAGAVAHVAGTQGAIALGGVVSGLAALLTLLYVRGWRDKPPATGHSTGGRGEG